MTLPVSGAISFNNINVELGVAGTTQASLGQASYRTLAAVPSGAISMSNFYGKSSRATASYTYTANINMASLNITILPGYVTGNTDVTITVNAGVYLYSTSTGTPGLTLSGGSTGDTVTLVNNGFIIGKGGNGAGITVGDTLVAGTVGGPALKLGFNTTINNTNASAYIGGGGGGGGSIYGFNGTSKSGSSGGGGAGGGNGGIAPNGAGGTIAGGVGTTTPGASGANGNISSPGSNASGGGGGLIIPGTTTAGPTRSSTGNTAGNGGSAGGSGPNVTAETKPTNTIGASGGASNSAGGVGTTNSVKSALGGGGGGWGASGGAATSFGLSAPTGNSAATAGGKAVDLNGKTVTWVSGDTTRVYGAVS